MDNPGSKKTEFPAFTFTKSHQAGLMQILRRSLHSNSRLFPPFRPRTKMGWKKNASNDAIKNPNQFCVVDADLAHACLVQQVRDIRRHPEGGASGPLLGGHRQVHQLLQLLHHAGAGVQAPADSVAGLQCLRAGEGAQEGQPPRRCSATAPPPPRYNGVEGGIGPPLYKKKTQRNAQIAFPCFIQKIGREIYIKITSLHFSAGEASFSGWLRGGGGPRPPAKGGGSGPPSQPFIEPFIGGSQNNGKPQTYLGVQA